MKKNLLKLFLAVFLVLVVLSPVIVSAQQTGRRCMDGSLSGPNNNCPDDRAFSSASPACTGTGLGNLICTVHKLLNSVIPVLVALGVVYFVWGVVNYVIADSDEAKKKGKDRIIFGIIGLTVIVSLWGLVNIVVTTFDLGGVAAPSLQRLTGPSSTCSLAGSPKFQDLACYITRIINDSIIPLIFAIATVMFIWGAVKFFIINVDEEAKKTQGKQFMIWGIIALAVMVSVWGLVKILGETINVQTQYLPQVKP